MTQRVPDNLSRKFNNQVPNMGYASDVIHNQGQFSLGAPAVAGTQVVVANVALTSGAALAAATILNSGVIDAKYGRCLTITSGGANTRVATIRGRDYLGQPMTEQITFAGAATVTGVKAFKYVDSVAISSEANTPTVSVGTSDKLGLPYKTFSITAEIFGNNSIDVTETNLIEGSTATASATSADPRGTYDPTSTLDGATELIVGVLCDASNLHGNAHYYA